MHEIYKLNAKTNDSDRFAFYTECIFKCGFALNLSSILSYFVYPLYMYFFQGSIITLLPTYIPGIDENTITGYVIISFYHIMLLSVALVAASACDFLFTMIITNTPVMAELIAMEVQKLNELLTSEKVDVPLAKATFKNILLMHRETAEWVKFFVNLDRHRNSLDNYRFVKMLDRIFFKICFAQIVGATGSNCVSVFLLMIVRNWWWR